MATGTDSSVIGRAHHFGFDLKRPKRMGWLLKEGGTHKAFKKRFFVLYKGFLVYYSSEEKFRQDVSKQTLSNRIHAIKLKNAEIHTAKYPPKGCHFGFTIHAPDPVNKRHGYLFNAQDKPDRKEWILALRESTDTPHKPRANSELEVELTKSSQEKNVDSTGSVEKDAGSKEDTKSEKDSKEDTKSEKDNTKPVEDSKNNEQNEDGHTSDVQIAVITLSTPSEDEEDEDDHIAEDGTLLVDKDDVDSEDEKGPEPQPSPMPPKKNFSELPLTETKEDDTSELEEERHKSPLPEVRVDSETGDSDTSSDSEVIQPKEGSVPPGQFRASPETENVPEVFVEVAPVEEKEETPSSDKVREKGNAASKEDNTTNGEDALVPPSGGSKKKRTSIAFSGKQGWLSKRGGKHKNWKQRWFVLSPGTFTYFKKQGDTKELGEVKLKNMQIFYPGQGEREQSYQFTVHTESSWNKRNDYVIAAKSEEEMKEWVEAFKLASQKTTL